MKMKDIVNAGVGAVLILVIGVMLTGIVPSFADTTETLFVSTNSEWQAEAGVDTINIEYATSSNHDIAYEGLIRWNGTDSQGVYDTQSYSMTGERLAVEYTYHSANDSEITLEVVDTDSSTTIEERNLTATGVDNAEEKTLRFDIDNSTHSNVKVKLTMDNTDAEVYDLDVSQETDNMTSTIAGSTLAILILGGLVGLFFKK